MDIVSTHGGEHLYQLYGLTVESWTNFPELQPVPVEREVEASFRLGEVPVELPDRRHQGARFHAAPGRLLVWLENVARYLALGGREVIVQPDEGALESDVRILLLTSPVGALLLQRGLLPLHASAISTPRGAVLFMGATGSGKSTLAAEFGRRGFGLLADDISVVQFAADGTPWVAPGYPQSKLWPDSAAELGEDSVKLPRLRPGLAKFSILPKKFQPTALPLFAIYLLERGSRGKIELDPITGLERVKHLLDHTYRKNFLIGLGLQGSHFKQIARLAEKTRLTRAARFKTQGGFVLTELADRIVADFRL